MLCERTRPEHVRRPMSIQCAAVGVAGGAACTVGAAGGAASSGAAGSGAAGLGTACSGAAGAAGGAAWGTAHLITLLV